MKTDSLHANHILILSLHIHCGGIQGEEKQTVSMSKYSNGMFILL